MPGRSRLSFILAAWLASISSSAFAQSPAAGDWSVVDHQPAGTALSVDIIGGDRLEGAVVQVRDVDITLMLTGGGKRSVPKSAVIEVRTAAGVSDPLRNGMTYGGLAGAAAMGALVAVLFSLCDETCDAPSVLSVLLPALALGAGSGIGAGAAVDAAIRRPLLLYRRATPAG